MKLIAEIFEELEKTGTKKELEDSPAQLKSEFR